MTLSVSIVSHGHGSYLPSLLQRLTGVRVPIQRVWVTFDVPDPDVQAVLEQGNWPFELRVIRNSRSQSFARNHNRAFLAECAVAGRHPRYWWVLNPDIDWVFDPVPPLLAAFADPLVGIVYPKQVGIDGAVHDYARRLPTLPTMLRRYLDRLRSLSPEPVAQPDWVSGACMVVRGELYARLGGFDEGYRLYVEDVEFCLRLQLSGYVLREAGDATITHVAQRRSRRDLRHLCWHLAGLVRLWVSTTFWTYLMRKAAR